MKSYILFIFILIVGNHIYANKYNFTLTVLDANGDSIQKALVQLYHYDKNAIPQFTKPKEASTDETGKVTFQSPSFDSELTILLVVTKSGYLPYIDSHILKTGAHESSCIIEPKNITLNTDNNCKKEPVYITPTKIQEINTDLYTKKIDDLSNGLFYTNKDFDALKVDTTRLNKIIKYQGDTINTLKTKICNIDSINQELANRDFIISGKDDSIKRLKRSVDSIKAKSLGDKIQISRLNYINQREKETRHLNDLHSIEIELEIDDVGIKELLEKNEFLYIELTDANKPNMPLLYEKHRDGKRHKIDLSRKIPILRLYIPNRLWETHKNCKEVDVKVYFFSKHANEIQITKDNFSGLSTLKR